jgi:hypothetical protein
MGKYPVYQAIAAHGFGDKAALIEKRTKMNAWNLFQAILNCMAAVLSLVPFVQ